MATKRLLTVTRRRWQETLSTEGRGAAGRSLQIGEKSRQWLRGWENQDPAHGPASALPAGFPPTQRSSAVPHRRVAPSTEHSDVSR